MSVTGNWYGQGLLHDAKGDIDWLGNTIKAGLLTSSYTFNQDTHEFWSDVNTNEITSTGYTAGGLTVASKTLTYDSATNEVRFDAADLSWPSSDITARFLIFYKSTGTSSTSPLLGAVNFGSDQHITGTFGVTLDVSGAVKITAL